MEEYDESDASMALVLHGKIRELVRQHLKDALEDKVFMDQLSPYLLTETVARSLAGGVLFSQAVKRVIVDQMNKY
jgi:ribosomal protein S3